MNIFITLAIIFILFCTPVSLKPMTLIDVQNTKENISADHKEKIVPDVLPIPFTLDNNETMVLMTPHIMEKFNREKIPKGIKVNKEQPKLQKHITLDDGIKIVKKITEVLNREKRSSDLKEKLVPYISLVPLTLVDDENIVVMSPEIMEMINKGKISENLIDKLMSPKTQKHITLDDAVEMRKISPDNNNKEKISADVQNVVIMTPEIMEFLNKEKIAKAYKDKLVPSKRRQVTLEQGPQIVKKAPSYHNEGLVPYVYSKHIILDDDDDDDENSVVMTPEIMEYLNKEKISADHNEKLVSHVSSKSFTLDDDQDMVVMTPDIMGNPNKEEMSKTHKDKLVPIKLQQVIMDDDAKKVKKASADHNEQLVPYLSSKPFTLDDDENSVVITPKIKEYVNKEKISADHSKELVPDVPQKLQKNLRLDLWEDIENIEKRTAEIMEKINKEKNILNHKYDLVQPLLSKSITLEGIENMMEMTPDIIEKLNRETLEMYNQNELIIPNYVMIKNINQSDYDKSLQIITCPPVRPRGRRQIGQRQLYQYPDSGIQCPFKVFVVLCGGLKNECAKMQIMNSEKATPNYVKVQNNNLLDNDKNIQIMTPEFISKIPKETKDIISYEKKSMESVDNNEIETILNTADQKNKSMASSFFEENPAIVIITVIGRVAVVGLVMVGIFYAVKHMKKTETYEEDSGYYSEI